MNDNKRKLYDALSKEYDLGSFEQFSSDVEDEGKRRKLYDAIKDEYDLPDFGGFSSQLGIGAQPKYNTAEANLAAGVDEASNKAQPTATPQQPTERNMGTRGYVPNRFGIPTQQPAPVSTTPASQQYVTRPGEGETYAPSARVQTPTAKMRKPMAPKPVSGDWGGESLTKVPYAPTTEEDKVVSFMPLEQGEDTRQAYAGRKQAKRDLWQQQSDNVESLLAASEKRDMDAGTKRTIFTDYGSEEVVTPKRSNETRELRAAQRALRNTQRIINAADNEAGFGQGLKERVFDIDNWDFGITDITDLNALKRAMDAFDKGEKLTESQQALLDAKALEMAVNVYFASDLSKGYQAGQDIASSLPFMAEFMLGIGSAASKATSKALVKYFTKRFAKAMENKVVNTAVRGGARVLSDLERSGLMTVTSGAVGTEADARQRMMGQVRYNEDEQGKVTYAGHTQGEDEWKARRKAATARTLTNFSEMFGEYLGLLGKGGRWLSGTKGGKFFGLDKVAGFIANVASSEIGSFIGRIESKAQFHGAVGEMAEELFDGVTNATFVGDQTLQDVFDKENLTRTALSVGIMSMFFSGAKLGGYGVAKGFNAADMAVRTRRADRAAANAFGEQWDGVREQLDGATAEQAADMIQGMYESGEYTDEQLQSALNYVIYKKGNEMIERYKANNQTPQEAAAEQSYNAGYDDATTDELRSDIEKAYNNARQNLVGLIGEENVGVIDEDPLGMQRLYDNDPNVSYDVTWAVAEYVSTKSAWDGVQQRIADDAADRAEAVREAYKPMTREDGTIHPVTLNEVGADGQPKTVYLLDGSDVVLNPDGSIDREKSSPTLTAYDPEQGKPIFIDDPYGDRGIQSVGEVTTPEALDQLAGGGVDGQGALNTGVNNGQGARIPMDGQGARAPERTPGAPEQYTPGMVMGVVDDAGQEHVAEVVGRVRYDRGRFVPDENGMFVEYTVDGQTKHEAPDKLNDMVRWHETAEQPQQPNTATETFNVGDDVAIPVVGEDGYDHYQQYRITDIEGEDVTVQDKDGNKFIVNINNVNKINKPQQPNAGEVGQAPTAEQTTPQEGNNADTRTPAQRTYDDMTAKYGEKASHKVDVTLKDRKATLDSKKKALDKAQTDYDDAPVGKEDKAEAALAKAQEEYDNALADFNAWDEVRKLRDQALLAQSEAEDAARKAERERRLAEETEAQRKQREAYEAEQARRKAEAEAAEKRRQEENERLRQQAANPQPAEQPAPIEGTKGQASQLAIARQELEGDPEALAMLDETTPRTLVEVAATLLASGKNATKLLREDFKRETGYSDADVKRYPFLFAGADKGGITLSRFGEMVVEAAREYGVQFDENDATAGIGAALELLGSVSSQADINNYITNSRIAEAYDYHNAALAAARARMLEAYGMTESEYEAYMSWLEDAIEQGKSTLSDEEFNQLFNIYEQGQTTDVARGNQEGVETTERPESAETDVSQNGERGNGETDAGAAEQAAVSKYELQRYRELVRSQTAQQPKEEAEGRTGTAPQPVGGVPAQGETAQAIAAAEAETDTNPTEGQKEAGNYKKGHVRIDGYDITIEQPKGSVRRGTDKNGRAWEQEMHNTYGYIRSTESVDGDHIDIFLSDDPTQGNVYVVDQVNEDGTFDEHKVMYGFPDMESARQAYLSNYEDGWRGLGTITPVSKEEFKKWIESSHRKTKPFSKYKGVKTEGDVMVDEGIKPAAEQPREAVGEGENKEPKESGKNIADVEAGGAIVDKLEQMGVEVSADIAENRRVRKQAENDKSENGKVHELRTTDGKVYGFAYRGKLYLDPRKIDAELPLHEYAHLWTEALRMLNPKKWAEVVEQIKQDKYAWQFIKSTYPDLKTDSEIADEVIATFSGKNGAEKLKAALDRFTQKNPDYKSRWNAIFNSIAKALQDFWKAVGDFLNIKYESAQQIYDQVLKDFVSGMNPRARVEKYLQERETAYMQAAERGDVAKATEIFNQALSEEIGNGMTPFIAVGRYDRASRIPTLAHKVKSRDPKAIDEVAELIAPIIPKDAVLVPAPSHNGRATDMLDLAKAIAKRTGSEVADVLTSEPRDSQYETKKRGGLIASQDMGITMTGTLPEGKIPVVIDNVVGSGNTAEACVRAIGKGLVVSLGDAADRYNHAVSLKSAAPILRDRNNNIVPLSKRFNLGGSQYLGRSAYERADGKAAKVSAKERKLRDAIVDLLRRAGIDVVTESEEGQRVLDMARSLGISVNDMRRNKKSTSKTAVPGEETPFKAAVVSEIDAAKIAKNLDSLIKKTQNLSNEQKKHFISEVAKVLGARKYGSNSEYVTFETKNGEVTLRLADHNAKVSNFDYSGKENGISIVISRKPNTGIENDGNAHIVEYFYPDKALKKADNSPYSEIVRSIQQMLYSGEYKDTTGLAQRQEVNAEQVRMHMVKFFRTESGEAYGFTMGGKIYLDPKIATAETPVHEYTHLWAAALRAANPKAWEQLKSELAKDTELMAYVRRLYPELDNGQGARAPEDGQDARTPVGTPSDELMDEVFAHFSGRRGAERLREEQRKVMDEASDYVEKAGVVAMFERLRDALKKFWNMARDLFAGKTRGIKSMSAEDFADMVLGDLVSGFKPDRGDRVDRSDRERDAEYMEAVNRGDMETAQRMVDEAARKAGYISENDFRMRHTAPNGRDGFSRSIDDVSGIYPEDLYSPNGYHYYGDGDVWRDRFSANVFSRVRNNPDALVKIYRAVPKTTKETKLRNGDWVSVNREYAKEHGERNINGGYKIIEDEVPAKYVYTDGNSLHEQGYDDGKEYVYQNTKNNRKLIEPVTYDDAGNVIPLSKRFNKRNADIRYEKVGGNVRFRGEKEPVFYSNAMRAVESIKQERATPEQWVKMIEKQGGLKAGEDKWLGLSEWLKGSEAKTLTKGEVLDYIRANEIQVEEVEYADAADNITFEALKQNYDTMLRDNGYDYAWEQLREQFGDDAEIAFTDVGGELEIANADAAAVLLGSETPINPTRLEYTTEGLDNKREIVLTVPTIEPWNEHDEVHFGEAGGGRAVAWVRFGETTVLKKEAQERYDAAQAAWDDFGNRMYDKYGTNYINMLDEADQAENSRLREEYNAAKSGLKDPANQDRVLVIDEIQSKRHQEGREKGYREIRPHSRQEANLRKAVNDAQDRYDEYTRKMGEKYGGAYVDIYADMSEEDRKEADRLENAVYEADAAIEKHYSAVPDAPFEKNWHEVALKRMLRFAAENGYDKVAWTTGEQQAERYDLGGLIDHIDIYPHVDNVTGERVEGEYEVFPVDKRGNTMMEMTEHPFSGNLTADEVLQYYGKDLGTRMMQAADKAGNDEKSTIDGEGLRIGGEGMKGFYDQILPRFMDKYGKKWGVKTGEVELPNIGDNGLTMWSVDVTDDMRESVMRGQPLFRPKTQSREGGEEAAQGEWYDRNSVERIGEFAGYTPKQIAKMNARQEESARRQFNDAAEKLHLSDTITFADSIDDVPGPTDKQRREWRRKKGWYSPRTGKIVIILGNHESMDDVMKSILHEGVAHHGLRQMFGEHFDTFLDNVYQTASPEIRGRINEMAKRHGWDFREATEEYLATLAEDTDFEDPVNQSWWKQVKAWFFDMLHKIGFRMQNMYDTITDNELRYILWRSYENLVNPGRFNSVVEEAKDIAKQYELKVGQWDESWNVAAEAEPNATMEFNGRRVPIWATNGRRENREDRTDRSDSSNRGDRKEWIRAAAEAKRHWPDAVVLERAGDYYEVHGEDARKAAKILGLPLVQKSDGSDTVGFPTKEMDTYLPRLVRAGARVAVVDSVKEDAVVYGGEDVEAVNARFNEELQQQIDGTLPKGHVYKMGMPSGVLLSTGFPNVPIELSASHLADKAKASHHPFALGDVKGLVEALQHPIAVFVYGDKGKAQNVIVEIQHEGKNFVVGIHFNQERRGIIVNDIRGLYPKDNAEWLNWISQGKALYLDKEKIQALINQQRKNLAEVDYLDLDSVAKIVKKFENPQIPRESFSENSDTEGEENDGMDSGIRFRDGEDEETIDDLVNNPSIDTDTQYTALAAGMAVYNAQSLEAKTDAIRAVTNNLTRLRSDMAKANRIAKEQKKYDKGTVKRVTDLARVMVSAGHLDGTGRADMKSLLAAIRESTGNEDNTANVNRIMDIMVKNQLRNMQDNLKKLLSIKGSKVDAKGVNVQGKLDPNGQQVIKAFKDNMKEQESTIKSRIADCEERMTSSDKSVADAAYNERAGLMLALDYLEKVGKSVAEEKDIEAKKREELSKIYDIERVAVTDAEGNVMYKQDGEPMTREVRHIKAAYKNDRNNAERARVEQTVEAMDDAIRHMRMRRIDAYSEFIGQVAGHMKESMKRAAELREAEKQRVEEIHHNANSDMEGRPAEEHYEPKFKDKLANNSFVRLLLEPLLSFEQMMRLFGSKSANGEGYLYNRFVRGWVEARQKELKGYRAKMKELDNKVKELFAGEKVGIVTDGGVIIRKNIASMGDLIRWVRTLPKLDVEVRNGGEMKPIQLEQGNLLYVYMVNKMSDGRMKLRHMGITDEEMAVIESKLDPRLKAFADWVQNDFLVRSRNEYNETHKRIFGANMAAIEDYFPLKILSNARQQTEEELDQHEWGEGITTVTGAIKQRTINILPLDLLGANALVVLSNHVAEMEHWNAYAEFNRDLNTLRTYTKFKNRVLNMASVYGSGEELWENFNNACQIATGSYRPAKAKNDKAAVNVAKGGTGAKVAFRINTALKQFLSMIAYMPDVRPDLWAKNIATPWKSWRWAMENLPIFKERWLSRIAGDPRLLKSEKDWRMWRSRVVELAARVGMTPNAFVDALTVSVGAKTIYESRKARYLKEGYSETDANKRAIQDAEIGPNQTQQSSESIFLSTIQVDRTWWAVMWSVFRNNSMGYQRQLHDAIRNLKRDIFHKGNREESIEFMTKLMIREGISEKQAIKNAKARYDRQIGKDVLRVATFGFLVEFIWNLGSHMWYYLFGDDDDEKKAMFEDDLAKSYFGSIEGLTGGDVLSQAGQFVVQGEGNPDYLRKQMPAASDMYDVAKEISKGQWGEAATDIVNLAIQVGIGVNPQSITDGILACFDICGGDLELEREALICVARIMQVPQSQIEQMYFDELGLSGKEVKNMSFEQLVERYAKYNVKRRNIYTPWLWDEEELIEKERKRADRIVRERLEGKDEKTLRGMYEDDGMKKMIGSITAKRLGEEYGEESVSDSYGSGSALNTAFGPVYAKHRDYVDMAEDITLNIEIRQAEEDGDAKKLANLKSAKMFIEKQREMLVDAGGNAKAEEEIKERMEWMRIARRGALNGEKEEDWSEKVRERAKAWR